MVRHTWTTREGAAAEDRRSLGCPAFATRGWVGRLDGRTGPEREREREREREKWAYPIT